MKTLIVVLFFVAAITAACAYWSPEYRNHGRCLATCNPDSRQKECSDHCLCYRRFDYPYSGYCLDPSQAIPKHFRNLGLR
uniref:Putative secreted peptide n=1 Tax=Hyalomma excavatum TaxID=257692 RepID=A0A131XKH5_9ACAR